MMKKILTILMALVICLSLIACNKSNSGTESEGKDNISSLEKTVMEPKEIVENFFADFEKKDYDSMQTFCSQECIDKYFHDADVLGMVWAKVKKMGEVIENSEESAVQVEVEMEPAKNVGLDGDTEAGFYVVMKKQSDGTWLINEFPTGY